jgi:hypothetical protein
VVDHLWVVNHVGFFALVVGRRSKFAGTISRWIRPDVGLECTNDFLVRRHLLKKESRVSTTTENGFAHIPETHGCSNHDHDVVHELSRRLDSLWRYDQYIANADGRADLRAFWREIKAQEKENVEQLKMLLVEQIKSSCY